MGYYETNSIMKLKIDCPWFYRLSLKKKERKSEPPHWICQHSYQQCKKSIMQNAGFVARTGENFRIVKWKCPSCNAEIRTPMFTPPTRPSHEFEM